MKKTVKKITVIAALFAATNLLGQSVLNDELNSTNNLSRLNIFEDNTTSNTSRPAPLNGTLFGIGTNLQYGSLDFYHNSGLSTAGYKFYSWSGNTKKLVFSTGASEGLSLHDGDLNVISGDINVSGRLYMDASEFALDNDQAGLPHASRVMMVRKFDADQTKRWLFINPRSGGGSGENDFSEGTCLNSRVVITDKRSWWSVPKYASNAVLSVQGSIYSEGIKCQLSGNWADYVFNSNYKLKTLEEVESYIKENNHLPGVPSAEKVETEGLDITDMQRLQMEKIEELTLYMIELKKQNDKLQSQNEEFQERILGLEVANK